MKESPKVTLPNAVGKVVGPNSKGKKVNIELVKFKSVPVPAPSSHIILKQLILLLQQDLHWQLLQLLQLLLLHQQIHC